MTSGSLKQKSNVRPNRLFTADTHIILYSIGRITNEKMTQIIEMIVDILRK